MKLFYAIVDKFRKRIFYKKHRKSGLNESHLNADFLILVLFYKFYCIIIDREKRYDTIH